MSDPVPTPEAEPEASPEAPSEAPPGDDQPAPAVVADEETKLAPETRETQDVVASLLTPKRLAPPPVDDRYSVDPDSDPRPLSPTVLANDSPGSSILSITQPAHGEVSLLGDQITYGPDLGFRGNDWFYYRTPSGSALVYIEVSEAVDDSYAIEPDSTSVQLTPSVLANDPVGSAVTFVLPPVHGTVTQVGNELYYTPSRGFSGSDTFEYETQYGQASAAVEVGPTGHAPVDDTVTIGENTSDNALSPLGNDPDGSVLTNLPTSPLYGTLTRVDGTGDFTYTPEHDFEGSDRFTYNTQHGTATVTIVVSPEHPPVDDSYAMEPGSANFRLAPGVLANDPAGSTLEIITSLPDRGNVTREGDDIFYSPNPGFTGQDSFTYATQYGSATVDLQVDDTGMAPVGDSYTVAHDSGGTLLAPAPLANDPAGSLFTEISRGPSHGTVDGPDGTGGFTYTPNPGYTGTDRFAYNTQFGTGIVSVRVAGVPAAVDDAYTVDIGQTLDVDAADGLLKNDTDATSVTLVDDVSGGGALDLKPDGSFTYAPGDSFSGRHSFTYTATGVGGTSTPATVTIEVRGVLVDDSYSTAIDTDLVVAASGGVLSNDVGDGLALHTVDAVSHGRLTSINIRTGAFTFEPEPGFAGEAGFYYSVIDCCGERAAHVTIQVLPPPTAVDGTFTLSSSGTLMVPAPGVLSNDLDTEGATVSAVTLPSSGTLLLAPDGGFTYVGVGSTPDSFTYQVTTAGGTSNVATVTIEATPDDPGSDGPGDTRGSGSNDDNNGVLPDTGAPGPALLGWGVLVATLGAVILVATRRRSPA